MSTAVLEQIVAGLLAVLAGERTPAQAALALKNAAMLLQDLSTQYEVRRHERTD